MRVRSHVLILGAIAFGLLMTTTKPARAQNYPGGSIDVRQHGYEHGYRDGYEYGRDARDRHVSLDYRTDNYNNADSGYSPSFGSRSDYRDGYRDGYKAGAEDGYNGSRNGLERTYVYPNYDPDQIRDDRNANVYSQRHWDYRDVASDIGYRDGVNAGVKDYREHHSFRPEQHDSFKDADHGYTSSYGSKNEYKSAYRAAYEAGYRDGFGLRR